MEYSREEKIEELKKWIKKCNYNIKELETGIKVGLGGGLFEILKNQNLEKQAYELLLHKLEKGEAK